MNCVLCDKPLTGQLDTFGDVQAPMRWDCYADTNRIVNQESWYGLAPHQHKMDSLLQCRRHKL